MQSASQLRNNITKVIHPKGTETWSKQTWYLAIIYSYSPSFQTISQQILSKQGRCHNSGGRLWSTRCKKLYVDFNSRVNYWEGRGRVLPELSEFSTTCYYKIIFSCISLLAQDEYVKKVPREIQKLCIKNCMAFRVVTSENNVGNSLRKTYLFFPLAFESFRRGDQEVL